MDQQTPAVELRDVSATYFERGQRLPVLAEITLSVAHGEFVAILGPSGSGKSTLLDVIAGLIEPDAGSVSLLGNLTPAAGRLGKSGYLRQRDLLMPWRTVVQNVAVGLEATGVDRRTARDRSQTALLSFGLDAYADVWPSQLSGGMRQRVAVLRTILLDTPVLLLDEPFASLDAITRSGMHLWLQNVLAASARSTILVTHDVEEALLLADRVLVVSPRPANIISQEIVPFGRPRHQDLAVHPEFVATRSRLIAKLGAVATP